MNKMAEKDMARYGLSLFLKTKMLSKIPKNPAKEFNVRIQSGSIIRKNFAVK